MMQIKVGIIGFGDIGQKRYKYLKLYPEIFKVIGTYDSEKKESPIPFYDSTEHLFEDVDAVFVATPHKFTKQFVIDALNKGKHVFSEKPPGINLKETEEIAQTKENYPNLKLKFGFNHRYHQSIIDAYNSVESLGQLIWLRGIFGKSGLGGWRANKNISGGGILLGQGIHMLDIFNLFLEKPFTEIQSMVHFHQRTQLEDNVFAIMRNDTVVAELHSSSLLRDKTFDFEAGYTSGHIRVQSFLTSEGTYGPLETETLFIDGKREQKIRKYHPPENSWEREIVDFGKSIQEDVSTKWGSIDNALEVMGTIDEIYKQNNHRN